MPDTIAGYRSALASRLSHLHELDIGHNPDLGKLLTSFKRDRPRASRQIPSWDLGFVLNGLMKPPFEPLKDASLKCLTFKTVFLIMLASAKRRSEVHAFLRERVKSIHN